MRRIIIPGRPVPKGRPRLGVRGRKAVIYTPAETRAYEEAVGWAGRIAGMEPIIGPVRVRYEVYADCAVVEIEQVQQWPKERGRYGDLDNYSKSIMDGLIGIAYKDDKQIVEIHGRRIWLPREEAERSEAG